MQPRVDVSVLVPVLNEERHIREAVASMQEQHGAGEVEFLFMDGRSEDATRAILTELAQDDPRIRVLDNPRRITPVGLNIGLGAARGEFVARMDAHTRYPPVYLAAAMERLRRGGADWVCGPQVPHGDGTWSRRVAMATQRRLGIGGATFRIGAEHEIETDTGFTGVWRRDTLLAHGGWDEGWPINQDVELAGRVRAAGGRIVCLPELAAEYIPRDSLRALARQYRRYGFYKAKTVRRHPHTLRRSNVLPPGLVLTSVAAVASPRPVARLARLGMAAYGAALVATAASAARRGRVGDALALPAVFATMHMAWGGGFLAGAVRFGPPLAALRRVVTLETAKPPRADQ